MKKNKLFIIGGIFLIILVFVFCFFISNKKGVYKNKDEQKQNIIEKNYIAYVNINPLIKLEFKETCVLEDTKGEDETYVCEKPVVTNYILVNEDAKNIYNNIDFNETGGNLYEVLDKIVKVARDEGVVFDKVSIKSDWSNFMEFKKENEKFINEWNFEIDIVNKKELENKKYTITFNSNGGTSIPSQEVEENNLVIKPKDPLKNGYKFVGWQLDGKIYDFSLEVTENLELVAVWEKITNTESTTTTKSITTTKPVTTSKVTTTKVTTTKVVEEDNYSKYDINLNDNVIYDLVHIGIINRIENACLDKLKEQGYVMGKYNGYDYLTLDFENEVETDYKEFYRIINGCVGDISQSSLNLITNTKGVKKDIFSNGNRIVTIETIRFLENKYEKLSGYNIFNPEKYNLIYFESFTYGWQEPALLDERICELYNLKCGRW